MTYDQHKREIEPQTIVLGLGYATSIIVAVGWVLTFTL